MKYRLVFDAARLQPSFGDYIEFAFPYTMVETRHIGETDEGVHTSAQVVITRASRSLQRSWNFNEEDLVKVLFEYSRRYVVTLLNEGSLSSREHLKLDSLAE